MTTANALVRPEAPGDGANVAGLIVLVYLFRDRRTNTFAYSADVTGRNLPRHTGRTKWIFVEVTSDHDLPESGEAVCLLRRSGFYPFEMN